MSDLSTTRSLLDFQRSLDASGSGVVHVVTDTRIVGGTACDQMNNEPWVKSAGAYRRLEPEALATTPSALYGRGEITASTALVWWPDAQHGDEGGVVVGSAVQSELALVPGSFVQLGTGRVKATTAPLSTGRNPTAERQILDVVLPIGRFDECWVEVAPGADLEAAQQVIETVLDLPDTIRATRLVQLDSFARDTTMELQNRPGNQGWWIAAGIITLIGLVQSLARRPELALYRALGTTRVELFLLGAAESLGVITIAAFAATTWTVSGWTVMHGFPSGDELRVVGRTLGSVFAFVSVTLPLAIVVASSGTLAYLLKER